MVKLIDLNEQNPLATMSFEFDQLLEEIRIKTRTYQCQILILKWRTLVCHDLLDLMYPWFKIRQITDF